MVCFAIRLSVRMALELGMVACASNFSTGKAEGGGSDHMANLLRKKQTKSKKGRMENEHLPFGVHY